MAKTIVLDGTTKSISAFTASVSGAAIDYIATWADSTSSTFVEGESDGQLTSSTPVTIVAAPAASTRRVIKTINLYNAGAYSETVTLTLVNGANTRVIVKVSIAPGVTWTSDDLITYATTVTATSLAYRNALINGDFQVSQRTPPLNFSSGIANEYSGTGDYVTLSGAYTHDRWAILHQSASALFSVSRRSDVPGTQVSSCAIRPTSTSAGKFGLLQIVDANNTAPLRGNPATLSFWAKRDDTAGTKVTMVKAVILQWSGTADQFPRTSMISNWSTSNNPPSFTSGVTQAANPTSILVNDVWTQFSLTVPTIAGNNVAVFIWNDRTDNLTTDTLFLTDVQLERGLVATPFETLPLSTCLARCYPYFYASWGGVVNGATSTANTTFGPVSLQTNPSNGQEKVFRGSVVFPQQMRALPTGSSKGTASVPAFRIIDSATNSLGAIDRPVILTTSRDRLEFTANSAITTPLIIAVSPTQTALALESTATFPPSGVVRLNTEYVRYTGVSLTSGPQSTTLSVAIAIGTAMTGSGTITVISTAAFIAPAAGQVHYAIINAEIFSYTGKTSTTLTGVTRARLGTVAGALGGGATGTHAVNATVRQGLILTGCTRGIFGSTAASQGNSQAVLYRFNDLTAGTYEMQHSGSVPSFFHASAEL